MNADGEPIKRFPFSVKMKPFPKTSDRIMDTIIPATSYWDMLPPEMKRMVLLEKAELQSRSQMKEVCAQIQR